MKYTSLEGEFRSAVRETKIIAKIIQSGNTCLVCFVSEPFLIELHHVGGRKNCSFTIPLCANCHLLASKNQISYDSKWLDRVKPDHEKARYVISDLEFLISFIKRVQHVGSY